MKTTSTIFSLKVKDLIKGAIVAIVMSIITIVYTAIQNNQFPQTWDSWKTILITSLGSGLAYLLKNWLTNSNDQFLTKEPPKA